MKKAFEDLMLYTTNLSTQHSNQQALLFEKVCEPLQMLIKDIEGQRKQVILSANSFVS
jgi:hypothetical protein